MFEYVSCDFVVCLDVCCVVLACVWVCLRERSVCLCFKAGLGVWLNVFGDVREVGVISKSRGRAK